VAATRAQPRAALQPARQPAPYLNPYLVGAGIGLVLLAAYVIVGRGLGASGAFSSVAAAGAEAVQGATRTAANPAFAPYLTDGEVSPLRDWLVLELIGVMLGAGFSAWRAGRLSLRLDAGGVRGGTRVGVAVAGGLIMGFGAKLARGCTSGQALTGGALLSVGSWIFIIACFAGGYAFAPLVRRLWP
jgi:uncharacterized membrane protein YedE/YeeE